MNILFLTYRMSKGFGVDVVVSALCRELMGMGHSILIGVRETDGSYPDLPIQVVEARTRPVTELCRERAIDVVIAHTPPFFSLLPFLPARTFVWDHGEPNWQFFGVEEQAHRRKIDRKKRRVYPWVDGVVCISEFIRSEIGYPRARVIHNGSDHVPRFPAKEAVNSDGLRIGTLMRLGRGEARYKGNEHFINLIQNLKQRIPLTACVMGRGTEEDARAFAGFEVLLNASEEEKWSYLRGLDIFVSCSLWEGFNLPLIEAQACGTLGLAFDTGAHPEVSPMVFPNVDGMADYIASIARSPELLVQHSVKAQAFVLQHFNWASSARQFDEGMLHGPTAISWWRNCLKSTLGPLGVRI